MTSFHDQAATDPADVQNSIREQNKVHVGLVLHVVHNCFGQLGKIFGLFIYPLFLVSSFFKEVPKHDWRLEEIFLCKAGFHRYRYLFGNLFLDELFVFLVDESVLKHSLELMDPQFDQIVRIRNGRRLYHRNALNNFWDISYVKQVMWLGWRWQKLHLCHLV